MWTRGELRKEKQGGRRKTKRHNKKMFTFPNFFATSCSSWDGGHGPNKNTHALNNTFVGILHKVSIEKRAPLVTIYTLSALFFGRRTSDGERRSAGTRGGGGEQNPQTPRLTYCGYSFLSYVCMFLFCGGSGWGGVGWWCRGGVGGGVQLMERGRGEGRGGEARRGSVTHLLGNLVGVEDAGHRQLDLVLLLLGLAQRRLPLLQEQVGGVLAGKLLDLDQKVS